MINLFVSYDLDKPGQNYPKVEKAIKELGTVSKLLTTLWYVRTKYSRDQCFDHINKATDVNDELLVIEAVDAVSRRIAAAAWKVVADNWNK